MADSPNPTDASQANIDDLVKELSRPQGAPAPAPVTSPAVPPSSSASVPPRPTMPSSAMPSTPQMPPKPAAPAPMPNSPSSMPSAAPKPPVTPTPAPAPAAPKEYQSSIRTMTDDLSKLKAGQQPQGVNIPRKVEPVAPVAAKPATPAPVVTPKPAAPTSSMPSMAKSAPLPASPAPAPAPKPAPAPMPSSAAPAIPRPSAPASVTMPAPSKAPELKPEQKSQFYVPPADSSVKGGNKNMLLVGMALLVVLLGVFYWYFMIRDSGTDTAIESPIVTFTPRPTATPIVDILNAVFPNRGGLIVLPVSGDPTSAFNNAIASQPNITAGGFTSVDISAGASASAQLFTIPALLNRFVVSYPPAFASALGTHFKFLLYGQKESFDAKGKPVVGGAPGARLVMVSEIASSSAAVLQGWEPTMSADLASVMNVVPAKNKGPFMTTTYSGISIRFKNFGYPDHSIDYTILQYGDKTYMIMASSREAMFAAVDAFVIRGK